MSGLWLGVLMVNGALGLAALYGWARGGARGLRPEVADDQARSLGGRA